MTSNTQQEFLLGVVTSAFFHWTPETTSVVSDLEKACQVLPVSVLEIGHLPEPHASEVFRFLESGGILRGYSAAGPLSSRSSGILSRDRDVRKSSLADARLVIDDAVSRDARLMVMSPGRDPGPSERPEAMKILADSLLQLASYARERSGGTLVVGVETMDRDVHRKQILGPTAEAASLMSHLRTIEPSLGLVLDLAHIPMVGETIEDAVLAAGEALVHVHVGNVILKEGHPLYGDYHPPFGVPESEISSSELTRFISALRRSGYFSGRDLPFREPAVSLEVMTTPDCCAFSDLSAAGEELSRAWNLTKEDEG